LTFGWFFIDFPSCLENLVAFCDISWIHTFWEKSSHTHTHCMSWVIYLKFLFTGKFVLIEYLSLIYIFAYFCNAIWLFYQLIIHACSEANFWEKYFSANFSPVLDFQCEVSGWIYSYIRTSAVLPYADLAVAIRMLSDTSGQDLYRFKTCVSFSAIHTSSHFYWFIMASCVFFSWISPEILSFFAHIFSSHDLHCVFCYSFKSLCF
jgi:hypothetical protein